MAKETANIESVDLTGDDALLSCPVKNVNVQAVDPSRTGVNKQDKPPTSSSSNKRSYVEILSDDDENDNSNKPPSKAPKVESTSTKKEKQASPSPRVSPPPPLPPAAAAATPSTTTATSTISNNGIANAALASIPELADRYVPIYTRPLSPTFQRNPATFCMKPAYWRRWPTARYTALAQDLRDRFDLVPFARQHDLSVEEVYHVFSAVVVDPLYDEAERVRAKCEKTIKTHFADIVRQGEKVREWGKRAALEGVVGGEENDHGAGVKGIMAELDRVGKGFVLLVLENGSQVGLDVDKLSDADVKYLRVKLDKEQSVMLFGAEKTAKGVKSSEK